MSSDTIQTMQELQRMHQLNIELLEQLNVTCSFILEHKVEIPNKDTLISLMSKAWTLLDEIQADDPKILQYSTNRRKVTAYGEKERTDEEGTVP